MHYKGQSLHSNDQIHLNQKVLHLSRLKLKMLQSFLTKSHPLQKKSRTRTENSPWVWKSDSNIELFNTIESFILIAISSDITFAFKTMRNITGHMCACFAAV